MDLGLTTFLFLIINCLLMILGIVRIVIAIILAVISVFAFAHLKEASFCAYISNAVICGMNEEAIFVLGILAGNKNNVRFLNTYQAFILILIISKFFSLHQLNHMEDRLKQDMTLSITDAMSDQRAKITTSSKADDIQRNFQCCGTDGPKFWTRKDSSFPLPTSCCSDKTQTCDSSSVFKEGCVNKTIAKLPHRIFEIYRLSMIPACEVVLFIVGVLLIIMVLRTSSNSLA